MRDCSSSAALVTLRGGFVAVQAVVEHLVEMEMQRGFTFELVDGGRFRVLPFEQLTALDIAFLRHHRDEALRVLRYCAEEGYQE